MVRIELNFRNGRNRESETRGEGSSRPPTCNGIGEFQGHETYNNEHSSLNTNPRILARNALLC